MITSLIIAIVTQSAEPETGRYWEPSLLDSAIFEIVEKRQKSLQCIEIDSKINFDMRLHPGSESDYQSLEYVADVHAKYTHQTASGAPLRFGYIVSATGVLTGHATTGGEISRIRIIPPPEDFVRPGKTGPMPQQIDYNELLPFVERLLRYHSASLAGHYSQLATNPVSFNGTTFEQRVDSKSNVNYVKLKDIALFLKYSISDIVPTNPIGLRITKPNQNSLEFYMAANSFKKGEEYLELPDTTILINGELWVPTTVLDHLE